MSRPRTSNKHLPKYVTVIHGAYWYRPPNAKPKRIGAEHDYLKRQVVTRLQPADRERIREAATFLIFERLKRKSPSVGSGL